jgi:hypothetical protein
VTLHHGLVPLTGKPRVLHVECRLSQLVALWFVKVSLNQQRLGCFALDEDVVPPEVGEVYLSKGSKVITPVT